MGIHLRVQEGYKDVDGLPGSEGHQQRQHSIQDFRKAFIRHQFNQRPHTIINNAMSSSRLFAFPGAGSTLNGYSNDLLAAKAAAYPTTIRCDSDASPISSSNTSTYSSRTSRSAVKLVKAVASRTGQLLDKVAAQDRAGRGVTQVRIQSLAESMAVK